MSTRRVNTYETAFISGGEKSKSWEKCADVLVGHHSGQHELGNTLGSDSLHFMDLIL
jgi:hypothetical protein